MAWGFRVLGLAEEEKRKQGLLKAGIESEALLITSEAMARNGGGLWGWLMIDLRDGIKAEAMADTP